MDVHGPSRDGAPVTDEQLLDWTLGQLESPEREQVEAALNGSLELRRRGKAMRQTLNVIDQWQVEPPEADLAQRVCAFVDAERRARERRVIRPSFFSFAEIGAVAAAVLLMALVFVPPVFRARTVYQQNLCADNLRKIGVAMESYANVYADTLPFLELPAGGNWLNSDGGRKHTGTAPVFMLIREGRLQPADVICESSGAQPMAGAPGTLVDFPETANCSYSFQNLFGREPIRRESRPGRPGARIVPVLADRNPLFRGGAFCENTPGNCNSHNHGGDGQNVLYNDGVVRWHSTPEVGINRDNIWLAGQTRTYTGTETSSGPDDSFFAP